MSRFLSSCCACAAIAMHSISPNGRYIATLVRRNSALKDGRGGVEYTFRVTHGDYEGSLVSMRLWAPGRLRRADGLSTSQSIEIVVAHRVAASGRLNVSRLWGQLRR